VLQLFLVWWRCFGGFYGHCKRTDEVQSGVVRPTNAQVATGERLHLERLQTLERELHLRLTWDAFGFGGAREREPFLMVLRSSHVYFIISAAIVMCTI